MTFKGSTLPNGWAWTNLGEITEERIPQGLPGSGQSFDYVDISSVNNSTKAIDKPKRLSLSEAPSRARQHLKKNDVLVSMTRPNLNAVALVPEEFDDAIASTGFAVLRNIEVDPGWLFSCVRNSDFIRAMSSLVQGALYPAVKRIDVRGYRLPIPPLNEQRRIIAKLEALRKRTTRARGALDAIPPLLEKFRQSVLAAAFRGDLTADWRARNPDVEPASVLLEREKTRAGNVKLRRGVPLDVKVPDGVNRRQVPTSWSVLSVAGLLRGGALVDVKDGNHGAVHPRRAEFSTEGLPFVTAAQVRDYSVDYESAPKIQGEALARLRVGFAEPNDAILTHKGTVGRSALNLAHCVLTPQTTYYRCSSRALSSEFLVYYFSSQQFSSQYRAIMSQTTRNFVPLTSQYSLFVLLPPLKEQLEILRILKGYLAHAKVVEALVEDSLERSNSLGQAILAKAFRGELVPQDPNDEPASKLLERIRAARPEKPKPRRRRQTRKSKSTKAQSLAEPNSTAGLRDALHQTLLGHGPLKRDDAIRQTAAALREAGAETYQCLRRDSQLYRSLDSAVDDALGAGLLDEPAPGEVRAILENARDYTSDHWQHVVRACLGSEAIDRAEAIEACACWAAENMGLRFQRLPKNGVIARGLGAALEEAIRRGEVELLGSAPSPPSPLSHTPVLPPGRGGTDPG